MKEGRSKEYLKGTRRHGKYHLPMEKFLRSRLGRPWSEIHSELSSEFDRRTYVGYTFWRRSLYWHIATNCWIGAQTGTVYQDDRYGPSRVSGYYVHPFTGLLSYQPAAKTPVRESKPVTRHVLDNRTAIEKIEGIWYFTSYKKVDCSAYNAYYSDAHRGYETLTQRQLSGKELKAHKVINDSPEEIEEAKVKARESYKKAKEKAVVMGYPFLGSLDDFYGE